MAEHWSLLRVYGAGGPTQTLLEVIRTQGIDMQLRLGVWIAVEEQRDENGAVIARFPDAQAANRQEVEAAIRAAAAYPDIVLAVCVGNETQVFWSGHRSPSEVLIAYVREVRGRTRLPVTVAEVEKHWGLYRADRSPKRALADGG